MNSQERAAKKETQDRMAAAVSEFFEATRRHNQERATNPKAGVIDLDYDYEQQTIEAKAGRFSTAELKNMLAIAARLGFFVSLERQLKKIVLCFTRLPN